MKQPAKSTELSSERTPVKRTGHPSEPAYAPRCARKPQQSINAPLFFHPPESDCLLVSLSPPQHTADCPLPLPSETTGHALSEHTGLKAIESHPYDEENDSLKLTYDIVGGFSRNAVRVFWEAEDEDHAPQWIELQTFTGMQLKWISSKKDSPAVFALVGDDAYAYCDKNPCEACPFRCKRGFTVSVLLKDGHLVTLPLHQEPL